MQYRVIGRTAGKPSRAGNDLFIISEPLTPSMTSALKPVREEIIANWSSLSGRSGRLMTKTFWNCRGDQSVGADHTKVQ